MNPVPMVNDTAARRHPFNIAGEEIITKGKYGGVLMLQLDEMFE